MILNILTNKKFVFIDELNFQGNLIQVFNFLLSMNFLNYCFKMHYLGYFAKVTT